ncbi:hypothetical protein ACHAW5_000509 [Stephanodiscus triporus]|uniref:FAD-binding FR-type domain-containing protein n=1 Tax=Stephanodiscus triporus TaxID=2934178 RepID=A0ABD3NSH6_9STRA
MSPRSVHDNERTRTIVEEPAAMTTRRPARYRGPEPNADRSRDASAAAGTTVAASRRPTQGGSRGREGSCPPKSRDDGDHSCRRRVRLWYRRAIWPFWRVTVAQVLCAIYIIVLTFSTPPVGMRDPSTNDIVDPNSAVNTNKGLIYVNGSYRPVVAVGNWQKACLAISRASAFSMYPMLVIVFVTKMKATQCFLSRTPLSMYLGILNQAHEHHAHAGAYLAFDVWVHTAFHILRWTSQGNLRLLWTSAAGLSGLITVVATPLIAFPMMYYRDGLSYEVRKGLHFLFYLFAVGLCFHVPTNAIPNGGYIAPVLGSCIVLYTLDACYVYFFMCEKIETTAFHVLSSGARMSMRVSDRFRRSPAARGGGYAYVNIPWINNKQWHPFSLFEDPHDPSTLQVFLLKKGDWTSAVHKALSRDTTRPCWIKGPFPSPFSQVSSYDNQILVASGIGITPALAAISAFKSSRRINLIWAVRDSEMLEFFLEQMYLEHDGWNLIFYTGKKSLTSAIENANTNVRIIFGRPNLSSIIPNIIFGIESKIGLPEKYTMRSKDEMKKLLTERTRELDADKSLGPAEKYAKVCQLGMDLGFSMRELMDEIHHTLSGDISGNVLSSTVELQANTTTSPLSLIQAHRRRRSSEIAVVDSISSRADAEPQHAVGVFSQMCWASMRKVVNERGSNALLKPSFHPWRKNEVQETFVKKLDANVKKTWGIFYCGGSEGVISDLRGISMDYNVDLHIDSFAW